MRVLQITYAFFGSHEIGKIVYIEWQFWRELVLNTRLRRVLALLNGTLMYFSSDGTKAHVWSSESTNPLFVVRREDFEDTWSSLVVGAVVKVLAYEGGRVQRITRMDVLRTEDEEL